MRPVLHQASLALALGLTALPLLYAQQPEAAHTLSLASTADLTRARELITRDHFQQAEALLRNYLSTNDRSAEAHRLLAYCLLRENRPREALPEYTQADQLEPPTAQDFKNVAQAYALLGDTAEADKWLTLSVQKDSADPDAWYNLGRVRYTQQRFQDAVACFEKTLTLAPKSVKAENNLGLAFEGLNRNDEAIEAYKTAIAWEDTAVNPAQHQPPGMEQPLLNLAIALLHRDQAEQALPLLTRASSLAPRDPRIHEQLGHVYLQKEDAAAAQSEFEQAVALDPSNSALHFLLGQTYRRRGQNEKARVEFARAAEIIGTHSSKD